MIVTDEVKKFLLNSVDEPFPTLRAYAIENHIPVLQPESVRFLIVELLLRRPENILEIGTAIGYSAIVFAKALPDSKITTIEVKSESAFVARKNFETYGVSNRVELIEGDASLVIGNLKKSFDCLFIDAQKSRYGEFLDKSKPFLKDGALVIADNILLNGMVADESIVPAKKRSIVRNMRSFDEKLSSDSDFITSYVPIGDGIAIGVYKARGIIDGR